MRIPAKEAESFKETNAALKLELKRMRDVVNANQYLIKQLANDALLTYVSNNTLTMKM